MKLEDELFLGNEPLPASDTAVTLDILSQDDVLRGEELAQKRILEGKITLNPRSCPVFSVSPPMGTAAPMITALRAMWDFYLVVIPFTLHPAPGNNHYDRVSFLVKLTNPEATAFDLFPKNMTTPMEEIKTYTLSSEIKIQETGGNHVQGGRQFRFSALPSKITAFGEGQSTFYWVYEGLEEQKEVVPGTKHALVVLRVPRGTRFVDGTIDFEVAIAKKLLGAWRTTTAVVRSFPIHFELSGAAPFFVTDTPLKEKPDVIKEAAYFDVCIVCALPEEAQAFISETVRQHNVTFQRAFDPFTKYEYRHAVIQNNKGEPLSIQVSWLPRYGPMEAGLHLTSLLEEFKPRFVAMIGICAGDRRKVKLGDIIVAERTFSYDIGKFVRDESGRRQFLHDAVTWQTDPSLLQFVRMFDGWKPAIASLLRPYSKRQQRDWLLSKLLEEATPRIDTIPLQELQQYAPDWRRIVYELQAGPDPYLTRDGTLRDISRVYELRYGEEVFPYKDPVLPSIHIAPMASGSAVRSDNPFADVQIPVRGTVAIDMEGAAFYRTIADFPAIRFLLVKGVGDYADNDKDDSYHEYASSAAAAYTLCFIKEYVTASRMPRVQQEIVRGGSVEAWSQITSPSPTTVQPTLAGTVSKGDALNVFLAYASEDEALKKELEKHLMVLIRQGWITRWDSRKISAGREWAKELDMHLKQARIILVLVSLDFLASDYCYGNEMKRALKMHKAGKAYVIPILLRATDWKDTPLGKLFAVPRNNKPVTEWQDRDAAFADVARQIRTVVEQLKEAGTRSGM